MLLPGRERGTRQRSTLPELPDDYTRKPLVAEASVRHTIGDAAALLPIDIYLETGSYAWSGMLNQPSGTFQERGWRG